MSDARGTRRVRARLTAVVLAGASGVALTTVAWPSSGVAHEAGLALVVSTTPDRAGHVPLAGAQLQGRVYISTEPDAGVRQVAFRLDDPTSSRPPRQVEGTAPFDFAGTGATGALPFDTGTLTAGTHTVTAEVTSTAGAVTVLRASFSTGGGGAAAGPAAALRLSTSPTRSPSVPLEGATASGAAYAFVSADPAAVQEVRFWLDDPSRSGPPTAVERSAPYDLSGTASGGTAVAWDTGRLADGPHTVTVAVTGPAGTTVLTSSFSVRNSGSTGTVYAEETPGGAYATEAQGVVIGDTLYQFSSFDGSRPCCFPTALSYKYSTATRTWSSLPALPPVDGGPGGVTHAGVATDGRRIYLAGGYPHDPTGTKVLYGTDKIWRYDTWTGTWAELPLRLPVKIAAGQIALLDGRMHYFGGHTYGERKDSARHWAIDLADPSAGWRELAPMPDAVNHLGAVVLGGKIYAVGGQHRFDGESVMRGTLQVYDPQTDRWQVRAPLPTPRSHITSSTFVLGGRLVVAGGEKGTSVPWQFENTAEVSAYDPATDRWSALTPLPEPRRSGIAGALPAGRWIYSGGSSNKVWSASPQ